MTRIPLRDIKERCVSVPRDEEMLKDIRWLPVSTTEFHLVSRYYPLGVRFDGHTPRLGLILDQRYLVNGLTDEAGNWRGPYRPIALRCFPFEAPEIGGDPLSDILVDPESKYLSDGPGVSLTEENGEAGSFLQELHRLLVLLKHGQDRFHGTLDHFLIAHLLAPLPDQDGEQPLYVVDPGRFALTENNALGAMTRHGFMSVDVAIACIFSMQNLRPHYRPKNTARSRMQAVTTLPHLDTITIDDLSLALDDGELVSLPDFDSSRNHATT
jgi:hypothetical protein